MKKKHCPSIVKNSINLVKSLFVFALFVTLFPFESFATTSQTINFQGKIVRNDTGYEGLNVTAGNPACVVSGSSNDTCDFQIKYYDASSGGNLLLTEDFSNVEIGEYNGAFNLSLGSDSTPTAGTYSSLNDVVMSEDDLYVELLFAPSGDGATFSETFSRMSVQASAYALRSKYSSEADTAFQFDSAADGTGYTSASAGMVYYDSDENVLKMYNGSSWIDITTGSGGSSLFTDGGDLTYLTSLTDHLVLGASSYTAIGTSTYDSYIDTNISSMPPFAFDMGAERLTLSGSQQRSGLTVYSDYSGASAWPLVSFKAEDSGFSNTVLELVQDGTGDIFSVNKGSTEVWKIDNNGAAYFHNYTSFTGTTTDRLYNVNGTLYWDGNALSTGSGLWTDGGTFTYLSSTTDDLILGGDSGATSKFFFDVSEGNLGIGTATPSAKLDIAGTSVISNTTGDLTITPDDAVVIKANDTEADNLMEWQSSVGTVLGIVNYEGKFGIGTSSPLSDLHVVSDSGTTIQSATYGGTARLRLLEDTDGGSVNGTGIHLLYNGVDNELRFDGYVNSSVSSTIMTLERSGNVGIGTAAPVTKFQVTSSTDDPAIIGATTSEAGRRSILESPAVNNSYVGYTGTSTNHAFGIKTFDIERLKIDTSGYVGIGNSSPTGMLDINGTGSNLLRLQTSSVDKFVVDSTGKVTMSDDIEVEGGMMSLGTTGDKGSIRYNTTDNVLEYSNDGTNWVEFGGTSKTVTLSAEYAGAVLVADGSSNTGSMTSDAVGTSGSSMNYYEWSSSETSLNDYDVRVRYTLPTDFDNWGSGGMYIDYSTESSDSANCKLDWYVYEESSGTIDAQSTSIAGSAGTWGTRGLGAVMFDECDAAGETCVLLMRMSSKNDNYIRIGDIKFVYDRKL